MSNSNHTLRFDRTSKDAFGYQLKSFHFQPPPPDVGDKWVGITCVVVAIVLPVCSYIFGWKIGG